MLVKLRIFSGTKSRILTLAWKIYHPQFHCVRVSGLAFDQVRNHHIGSRNSGTEILLSISPANQYYTLLHFPPINIILCYTNIHSL